MSDKQLLLFPEGSPATPIHRLRNVVHLPVTLFCDDCLVSFDKIQDESIRLVFCDPPYGQTAAKWDNVIPFDILWEKIKRVLVPNGDVVLTAIQPFTSKLILSNLKMFRFTCVWKKNFKSGFLNANKQPLRDFEDICVFYDSRPVYNPQMREGRSYTRVVKARRKSSSLYGRQGDYMANNLGNRYPTRVLEFDGVHNQLEKKMHPTQKPVELMRYFIETYANPGDTVLDFAMGSGSTGVAAVQCGRRFIGMEKDQKYFEIAVKRIYEGEGNEKQMLYV